MSSRKKIEGPIPDELSPDFSVCEHCGKPIGWDDIGYTHMDNGFATCGTIIGGGTDMGHGITVNPEIIQDPDVHTVAEPREWFT